jgi:hypothetical protein
VELKRQLEDWIDGFMDWTVSTEPPRLYRKWVAVSTIAAALGRRCCYNLGQLIFYPNFYVVLVGPPAARKGTAMSLGRHLGDDAGLIYAPSKATVQALVDMMKSNTDMSVDGSGTTQFNASVNINAPELTMFLGYNQQDLLAHLCDWFDCPSIYRYKTINRGEETLNQVWVNLLGATTPSLLRTSLPEETVGGGLASRTIFVYEEDKERMIVIPGVPNEKRAPGEIEAVLKDLKIGERKLVHDLNQMKTLSGPFRFGPGVNDAYYQFRAESEIWVPKHPKLSWYKGRRPGHVLKLAMVFSAARGNSMIISTEDLQDAIDLLEETEIKMPRTYAGVGQNPLSHIMEDMKEHLQVVKVASIRQLVERYSSDLTLEETRRVIQTLAVMKAIKYDAHNEVAYWAEGDIKDVAGQRGADTPSPPKGGKDKRGGHSSGWSNQPVD